MGFMDSFFGKKLEHAEEVKNINEELAQEGVEGSVAETSDLESVPHLDDLVDQSLVVEMSPKEQARDDADREAMKEVREADREAA